jgi:hypothetical protein
VRVPIFMVIPLCLLVIAGMWWQGTRKLDFMTPPPESRLVQVKQKVLESFPAPKEPAAAPAPPPPLQEPQEPRIEAKPEIDLGQLGQTPALNEYMDRSELGAAHFMELAAQLEEKGEFQRALLAWERTLDVGKPDVAQANSAVSAIKRLRPTLPDWNTDAGRTQTITLQAGTGRSTAKVLGPLLEAAAAELTKASSGLLKVSTKLTPGKEPKPTKELTPIAVWLSGPEKDTRSTEVMSFKAASKDTLPDELRRTIFQVLRGYLTRGGTQQPPPALAENSAPVDGFNAHITRQQWLMLGTVLNLPVPKPVETPVASPPPKPAKPKKTSKKP